MTESWMSYLLRIGEYYFVPGFATAVSFYCLWKLFKVFRLMALSCPFKSGEMIIAKISTFTVGCKALSIKEGTVYRVEMTMGGMVVINTDSKIPFMFDHRNFRKLTKSEEAFRQTLFPGEDKK